MSIELHFLILSILLGLVHLLCTVLGVIYQHGLMYTLKSRDEQKPLTGRAARFSRAFDNFMETFVFFAAAILIIQVTGVHTFKTAAGAALYFCARVIYIPVYTFGIPVLRTLVWTASIVGIVLILCGSCH